MQRASTQGARACHPDCDIVLQLNMSACDHCHAELSPGAERCTRCDSVTNAAPDDLIGAELLGRYRVVRLLAEGGMGRVYVAEQSVGTAVRRVAIKVLRRQLGSDPQLATRFAREAETLVALTHPNTVQLFDFGALGDGTLALVMEYVEGRSLAAELARGPLPLPRVQRILSQICGALKEAHARGIVHRDLKPDNILICDREGHTDFVKVLDFGIASVADADAPARTKLTQQGMMIGTPPYMSPEQFMGAAVDARSDVYSLALIAYELLSGRSPFEANTPWEWASKHMTAQPAPLPVARDAPIGRVQARAIERALAKTPADRPAGVDAFLAEFAGEVDRGDAPATGPSTTERDDASPAGVRSLARSAAMGALLAALAAGALLGARALWRHTSAAEVAAMRSDTFGQPGVSSPKDAASAIGEAPGSAAAGEHPPPVQIDERPQRPRRAPASTTPSGRLSPPARPPARTEARSSGALPASGGSEQPSLAPRRQDALAAHASASTISDAPVAPVRATALPTSNSAQPPSSGGRTVPSRTAAVPPDLQSRVEAISDAANRRPELAVGLFQAAAARYGAQNMALSGVRREVQQGAAQRITELLANGRCPQAQALQRALTSIQAGSSTARLFGGRCVTP